MLRYLVCRAVNRGYLLGKRYRQWEGHSDRPKHSVYLLLPSYSHHTGSPFLLNILGIGRQCLNRFLKGIAGAEKVEENALLDAMFSKIEVKTV